MSPTKDCALGAQMVYLCEQLAICVVRSGSVEVMVNVEPFEYSQVAFARLNVGWDTAAWAGLAASGARDAISANMSFFMVISLLVAAHRCSAVRFTRSPSCCNDAVVRSGRGSASAFRCCNPVLQDACHPLGEARGCGQRRRTQRNHRERDDRGPAGRAADGPKARPPDTVERCSPCPVTCRWRCGGRGPLRHAVARSAESFCPGFRLGRVCPSSVAGPAIGWGAGGAVALFAALEAAAGFCFGCWILR
jgi:hypothetical protein